MDKKAYLLLESQIFGLQELPGELKQKFSLMRELDNTRKKLQDEADKYVEELAEKSADERKTKDGQNMKKSLEEHINQILRHSTEKVSIAQQVYDIVDSKIRSLDENFVNLKRELYQNQQSLQQQKSEKVDQLQNLADQKQQLTRETNYGSTRKRRQVEKQRQEDQQKDDQQKLQSQITNSKMSTRRKDKNQQSEQQIGSKRKANTDNKSNTEKKSIKKSSQQPVVSSQEQGEGEYFPGLKLSTGPPKDDDHDKDDKPSNVNPDDPRYCICNDVSYGDMIACGNPDCNIEWFHFKCVGIDKNNVPQQWICDTCRESADQQ